MKQQDVHLFVFDSLADWEPGYAVAGINNPQFQLNPGSYRIRTVSLRGASVQTIGGIRIEPDLALDSISPEGSAMLTTRRPKTSRSGWPRKRSRSFFLGKPSEEGHGAPPPRTISERSLPNLVTTIIRPLYPF